MDKIQKLLESINKDAKSRVRVESLGGSKAQVIVDDEVVDIIEFEPGDNIEECLQQYM